MTTTRPRIRRPAVALAAIAALAAGPARADRFCDEADTTAACEVSGGSYHVRVPDGDGPFPVVLALHSSGENGATITTSEFYASTVVARGYALVAPDGSPQVYADGTTAPGWHLRGTGTGGRDDISFLEIALRDAAERFPIDIGRVLTTGYGLGASLAWETACFAPETASAYVPRNGGFYGSLPETCAAPFRLMHVHSSVAGGWPLTAPEPDADAPEGAAQVPVQATLELAAASLGCAGSEPVTDLELPADSTALGWQGCAENAALALFLHKHANFTTAEVVGVMLDWFEESAAPARPPE